MPFQVHITRARNGWLARFPGNKDLDIEEEIHVYSDVDIPGADQATIEACSLREALMESFQDYTRSKHKAGIWFDVLPSRTTSDAALEGTTQDGCPCAPCSKPLQGRDP